MMAMGMTDRTTGMKKITLNSRDPRRFSFKRYATVRATAICAGTTIRKKSELPRRKPNRELVEVNNAW
jgi:hypothetical protein